MAATCQFASRAPARPRSAARERQVPGQVDDPVVLRVVVGQALVVVGLSGLREGGDGAVRGVGEEGRGLGGVEVARERVGRLERHARARGPPHLHDERVVPGPAVARLHLDGRERGVGAGRGGGVEERAAGQDLRCGDVQIGVAEQVPAPGPRVAARSAPSPEGSRCTLTFQTCTRGLSRSHWTGRIEWATRARSGGRERRVRDHGRGVAGGLVTVTIRFCWLLVLKYRP